MQNTKKTIFLSAARFNIPLKMTSGRLFLSWSLPRPILPDDLFGVGLTVTWLHCGRVTGQLGPYELVDASR